jgi:hypothetical protein
MDFLPDDAVISWQKRLKKIRPVQVRHRGGRKRLNPALLRHSNGCFDN